MLSLLSVALFLGSSHAAEYWVTKWSDTPGPWHGIYCSVDDLPWQNLTFLPSLTKTSLLIDKDTCSQQSSVCPNQVSSGSFPMFSSTSQAHKGFLYMDGNITDDADDWDDTVSGPLRLEGSRQLIHETYRLWSDSNATYSLNMQASTLTHNLTANYPSGNKYTMNVGFFSLYGAENGTSWLNKTGSTVTQGFHLPTLLNTSNIGSTSYGLHIGSPNLGIEPSLVLGGYDRSRCLTEPIASNNQTFSLTNIAIGARQEGWPFKLQNNQSVTNVGGVVDGLLGSDAGIQAMPNPGVPYLYLPQDTCDAIAKYLPVTYDEDFGLYTWDTDDSQFEAIVSSMSYLSFTLQGSGAEQDIIVPFALLNLTLDYPLTRTPIRYFPCSPYTPANSGSYHLGRAFLQAALLVQNWQSEIVWLSQAPGPDATDLSTPIAIEPTDASISAMPSPPGWAQTWNTTLRALSENSTSTGSTQEDESSSSISGGAIAGIVVGVVAGIGLVAGAAFFLIRRRRSKAQYGDVPLDSYANSRKSPPPTAEIAGEKDLNEAASVPVYEVEGGAKGAKMEELPTESRKANLAEVQGSDIAELPAQAPPSR